MKLIRLTLLMVLGLFVVSCESDTYSEISGTAADKPTYEANIKPIMTAHCTSCHSAGGERSQTPYETYEQVKLGAAAIACRMDGQFCALMPASGRIPQSEIDTFNRWIEQGYVEK